MPDDSDVILFIPGVTCTGALWAPQIEALSGRYSCVVADHTRSDSMSGIARDILAEAPGRFSLCGLSMGGYIAFEIMRQAPERVVRLALLDTQATPESDAQRVARALRMRTAEEQGMSALSELQWPQFVPPYRRDDLALRETLRRMAVETGPEAFRGQSRAIMDRPDSRPDLPFISVPTLILTGSDDQLTPPIRAKEMAATVRGAELLIIPQCGHISTLEQPDEVSLALQRWLTRSIR